MTTTFPLSWPDGWPRTPASNRKTDNQFGGRHGLTMGRARDQLVLELQRLHASNVVLSANLKLRPDGLPYAETRRVADPGVAVYFVFKKKPMVMAMDHYLTVAGNIRSLTLAIEAMRQLDRHGGGTMLERAFVGFVALAAPDSKKPWREVFGVPADWRGDIRSLYREKARNRHPDVGGSDTLMAELNVALAEARRELSS